MMAAVWLRFHAELRTRWRAWLVLALLVGVAGGVVLGALAGARRTDSAYPDFLESQRAYDVLIISGRPPFFDFATFDLDEIEALPAVTESARIAVVTAEGTASNGAEISFDTTTPIATVDGRYGTVINKLRILEGRAPRRPNEVAASFVLADDLDLHVGDRIDASFFTQEGIDQFIADPASFDPGEIRKGELRIVGIEASPGEFPPLSSAGSTEPFLHFAPTFVDSPLFAAPVEGIAVRVRGGADGVTAFKAELERRSGGRPLFLRTQAEAATATLRAIGVQADALRIVALLAGVAGIALVGLASMRQARAEDEDVVVLCALGMSPQQLRIFAGLRAAVIGLAGATVAVILAVALSPLAPVGFARKAEIHPGVSFDVPVLALGALAVVIGTLVAAIPAMVRVLNRGVERSRDARVGRVADSLARAGCPATVLNGVRMALESGRSRSAAPVRSTIAGVTLAVIVLVGVAGFSASLDRLLEQPAAYGWNWDVQVGDPFSPDFGEEWAQTLGRRDDVAAVAIASSFQVTIAGRRADVLAMTSTKGGLLPTIASGRAPRGSNEIAVGAKTLSDLGRAVGDRATLRFAGRNVRKRIVGIAVLPDLGEAAGLGRGLVMTRAAASALVPNAAANIALVRASSPERINAIHSFAVNKLEAAAYRAARPLDLLNIQSVDSMPFVIAGSMVLIAIATVAHGLVASVRRRRRELAILKTLGMRRGQISLIVFWQATTIAAIALVIGIPLGIVVGNVAWTEYAQQLGTLPETVVGAVALGVLVPTVFLVANAAAAVPGWMAARTKPASILRSE